MLESRMISSKGQVVIPKSVRDYLQIKEGDMLSFQIKETGEVYVLPMKASHLDSLFGMMPPKQGMDTSDLDQVIRESRQASIENREDDR
jgi:AbrB family looped-hinge helix DNA binding protein